MSKGSRVRSFGKKFDQNFDTIFQRKPGFQWATELRLRFAPLAWKDNDEFHNRDISRTEFNELYEKSKSL